MHYIFAWWQTLNLSLVESRPMLPAKQKSVESSHTMYLHIQQQSSYNLDQWHRALVWAKQTQVDPNSFKIDSADKCHKISPLQIMAWYDNESGIHSGLRSMLWNV